MAMSLPPSQMPSSPPKPWWKFPIVWMVIAGPVLVVIAGVVTAVIAWRNVDPVLDVAPPSASQPAEVPAMQGRNKAAEISVQPPSGDSGKR